MGELEINEKELMKRLVNNDLSAWAQLVQRYSKLVYSISYRILKNNSDAEDAVQNTFVRLKLYANKFDKSQPLNPWLARIASGEAIRIYNRNKNTQKKESVRMDTKNNSLISQRRSVVEVAEKEEMENIVKKAIELLPDTSRIALTLYYAGGLSQTEIANEMGVSQVSISEKIKNGLEKVKTYLKKSGFQASIALSPSLMQECIVSVSPTKEFLLNLANQLPTDAQLKFIASQTLQIKTNTLRGIGSNWLFYLLGFSLVVVLSLFYFKRKEIVTPVLSNAITTKKITVNEPIKSFEKMDIINHSPFYLLFGKIQKEIDKPDILAEGLIQHRGGDESWVMKNNSIGSLSIFREEIKKFEFAGLYLDKKFDKPHLFKGKIKFLKDKSKFGIQMGTPISTNEKTIPLGSEDKNFVYNVDGHYSEIANINAVEGSVVEFKIYIWKDENKWISAAFLYQNYEKNSHLVVSKLTHINKPFKFGFYSNNKVECENFEYADLGENWEPFLDPFVVQVKDKIKLELEKK